MCGETKIVDPVTRGQGAGSVAVLHYDPWDRARDPIPPSVYGVSEVIAEYAISAGATNDFLEMP